MVCQKSEWLLIRIGLDDQVKSTFRGTNIPAQRLLVHKNHYHKESCPKMKFKKTCTSFFEPLKSRKLEMSLELIACPCDDSFISRYDVHGCLRQQIAQDPQ